MRIADVRERTISVGSAIANADIDFSRMTCSVVAVITDVMRDGRPVVGFRFNSNGRDGPGALMRVLLNIAAGLKLGGNEFYPDVFQGFGGFADGIAVEDGDARLPDIPGIGLEAKPNLDAVMRELAE